jgi:hypothetical protein
LAFASGKFQNLHVLLIGNLLGVSRLKQVVGDPKLTRREHLFTIAVILKRTRLTNQRINHMTIVDGLSVLAKQSFHRLHVVVLMSHDDLLGSNPHIDFRTDQPTRNRVRVGTHLDRTARANTESTQHIVRIEPLVRQPRQSRLFFMETFATIGVGTCDDLFDEHHVLIAAGKVTTASQQERLIDSVLDMSVGRFDVAVLVSTARVGSFRLAAVVLHECRVAIGERLAAGVILDGGTKRIGSMSLRHSAEFPKRFLNAFTQGLKRFRETERDRFDVAVSQHAMKEPVIESRSSNLHVQRIHNREVAGGQSGRMMKLLKVDRLAWPMQAPPLSYASLKGSASGVGKRAGLGLLQPLEERLGFEEWFGFESLLDFAPNVGERIAASSIIAWLLSLRRQTRIVTIVTRSLLIHECHPCRRGQWLALSKHPPQFLGLSIGNHRNLHENRKMRY